METKFEGELWADEERDRLHAALIAAPAVPVLWTFNKFLRWDNHEIRYTVKHPDWMGNLVCDSFDELVRAIEGVAV
jgi:hypothetical protein